MLALALKEHASFKKFGDALLTRSAKLQDLVSSIEAEIVERTAAPQDLKNRAKRPGPMQTTFSTESFVSPISHDPAPAPALTYIHPLSCPWPLPCPPCPVSSFRAVDALDAAVTVLDKEYENIEKVKADCGDLEKKDLQDPRVKELLGFLSYECAGLVLRPSLGLLAPRLTKTLEQQMQKTRVASGAHIAEIFCR